MYTYREDDDMILPTDLADLFYEIRNGLVWEINERHKIIKGFDKPSGGFETRLSVSAEQFHTIREAMWENPQWIDEYLADDQGASLAKEKRDVIRDWRKYFIKDKFLLVKHLRKYSVFMYLSEPAKLYGVYGLTSSLDDVFPAVPPFVIEAVLLPFKDRIVYDGLAGISHEAFNPEMRFRTLEEYNAIKDEFGIIERLNGENLSVRTSAFKIVKKNKSRRRRRR
jgi:hypothetical protein